MHGIRKKKSIVSSRQMKNRVNSRLKQYYAEVERGFLPNVLDMVEMPCIANSTDDYFESSDQQNLMISINETNSGGEKSNFDVTERDEEPDNSSLSSFYESAFHEGEPNSEDEFDDRDSERIETDVESLDEETCVNQKSESELRGELTLVELQEYATRRLREWVVDSGIAHTHATSLLHILNDFAGLNYLPRTTSTLLGSTRGKMNFKEVPPGRYFHCGVEVALVKILLAIKAMGIQTPTVLKLIFNVDGSSTSKSGYGEFWPILCGILGWDHVFVAGIYHGPGKPKDVNLFLADFQEEMIKLKSSGILFEGNTIIVLLAGMTCDAPATSFILNIKNHNAFYGCRKCTTKGEWSVSVTKSKKVRSGGRVTFLDLNASLRSDFSFRQRHSRNHHNKNGIRSIIEDVVEDLVDDVHLDYMHLVCIGAYKKLLTCYFSHPFDNVRLSPASLVAISKFRVSVQKYIPSDFARIPREVEHLTHWKATELRLDLLYLCPVIYKNFLSKASYQNMMLLHVAMRLLLENDSCQSDSDYSDILLRLFIKSSARLFGPQFVSFNVHSLCHLARSVKKHGSLEETSAFPFENKIQVIKNSVHNGGRDLEQAVRRAQEKDALTLLKIKSRVADLSNTTKFLIGIHQNGPTLPAIGNSKQYNKLLIGSTVLSNGLRDSCVIINDVTLQYFLIKNFVDISGVPFIIGRRYLKVESIFNYPLPSTMLFESVVSTLSKLELYPFDVVTYKCIRIPTSFPESGTFFVSRLLNLKIN